MRGFGEREREIFAILYRRLWWWLIPVVASGAVGWWLLGNLEPLYRAETSILVSEAQVPADFARTTIQARAGDRFSALRVSILSRTYLERAARETGLLPPHPTEAQLEQAVRGLRRAVDIRTDRRNQSFFSIAVTDRDPERAARIANLLAEWFIEDQIRSELALAATNLEQYGRWLEEKKRELDAWDARIADFERRYAMELPERLAANLQQLQLTQQELDSIQQEIRFQTERLDELRRLAQMPVRTEGAQATPALPSQNPYAARLQRLQQELDALLLNYTEDHPDVKRKRKEIADLLRLNAQAPEEGASQGAEPSATAAAAGVSGLAAEIAEIERRLRQLNEKKEQLEAKRRVYEGRVERTPQREQELKSLTRGQEVVQRDYDNLLGRLENARRAYELLKAKNGEQYQIQDRAVPPKVPVWPDPFTVIALSLLGGLAVAGGLVVIREYLDQTIHNETEFKSAFPDLPLLGAVPRIPELARPRSRRARSRP